MRVFNSVSGAAEVEIIVRKSRFIARVFPVDSEKEAEAYVKKVKEKHKDATHNVFAWQVGINKTMQRCSDDGEPAGTAGRPVLEVIKQKDLVNVLVVVTRYFGGIKLGAGGLIRAYSQAAREGLDEAGLVKKALHNKYSLKTEYSLANSLQNILEKQYTIREINFGEQVTFTVLSLDDNPERTVASLKLASGGQADIEFLGTEFDEI